MLSTIFDAQNLMMMGQLTLAVILGASIGIEREVAHKFAGMRTYALVTLGSTLFTTASRGATGIVVDLHVAAQIVTGIGFLGAGIIFFNEKKVQGLTTAAGIWVAAAIGMAIGFGFYGVAIFATLLTILVFIFLLPVEKRFLKKFSESEPSDE
ncbi:MAG: MgtC/SapB family protein [Patescibacteria group bacterium]|nr:MgtC/SapB family protein [Patescibacteria group bacterium]